MRLAPAFIILVILLAACDVFVDRASLNALREKENRVFVMKKDVEVEGKLLKRGEEVRIIIAETRDWIKVYAYPARIDPLKAERQLILYLFADDFKEKKFDPDFFAGQLKTVVAEK